MTVAGVARARRTFIPGMYEMDPKICRDVSASTRGCL